jgi:hypothetical protein
MSASIQVSDLKYDTNSGTISSVGIIIDSQPFSIVFKDNKYIVTNNGESLGNTDENLKEPDKKPVVEAKAKPDVKAKPEVVDKTKPKVVDKTKPTADSKSFKDNDELINILRQKENGFKRRVIRDTRDSDGIQHMGPYEWGPDRESDEPNIVDSAGKKNREHSRTWHDFHMGH